MARRLYYRDSYGRVHRDRQGRGRGVTIVVYGRTEIRLERVPDKDEAHGSSRRAPVARPQLDRGRPAGLGHGHGYGPRPGQGAGSALPVGLVTSRRAGSRSAAEPAKMLCVPVCLRTPGVL
jgi:hypothetical protein